VDPRTPDIILKVNTGVIFTGGSKLSEHGGFNEAMCIPRCSCPIRASITQW